MNKIRDYKNIPFWTETKQEAKPIFILSTGATGIENEAPVTLVLTTEWENTALIAKKSMTVVSFCVQKLIPFSPLIVLNEALNCWRFLGNTPRITSCNWYRDKCFHLYEDENDLIPLLLWISNVYCVAIYTYHTQQDILTTLFMKQ